MDCGQHLHHDRAKAAVGKLECVGIVQYKRQSDDADADQDDSGDVDETAQGRAFASFVTANEALLDAILYDWFPDRLPGELDDSLDLLRFWRMIEAKSVMSAEDDRAKFLARTPEEARRLQESMSPKQKAAEAKSWAKIAKHDQLLKDAGLWED